MQDISDILSEGRSFALESGKITGFIGRNDAGKTTTIKAMLNLIHTDSGDISYFGMPLSLHEVDIKQRVGYSTGTISWYPFSRDELLELLGKAIWGSVTLGDRGQIVIPKAARDHFGISGGDRLIVASDEHGIALILADYFEGKMRELMEMLSV